MGRERTPHLLGREQALGQLAAARGRVGPDAGALALVSGEAGIGKTRLLEEFAARNPDALVARGGCVEGVAYAPWTDALWWLIDRIGPDVVDDVPPVVAAQLGRLIPSLALTEPVADDDGGQQLLFEAVVTLLRQAATRAPLVLVVDDMHWIDPASRELLRHVAGNLRRVPILLVVAFRPEDSAAERELIGHLGRLGEERITLERLPEETTAEIATLLLGGDAPAEAVDRIARDADGNPLFVEELVAAAGTQGIPETLRDLMLARFSSLDDDARHLVRIAAVMGARSPRAWLAGASELSSDRARAATRAASDAGVLVAEEGAYEFRHALLRQAVLDELLPDENVELHRTIAHALTEHPEYAVGVDRTAELARHWDAAEEPAPALKWLVAAAQHARESYAFEAAFESYERALFWWEAVTDPTDVAGIDHAALLLEAADAAGFAGRVERAADLASAGMERTSVIDPERIVDAANRAYPLMWAAGRAPDLFEFAAVNVRPALEHVDRATRARFLVTQVEHLIENANAADLREPAAEMFDALDDITDPALAARAHLVSVWCFEAFGEYDQADLAYEHAARVARDANAHSTLALVLANHASFRMTIADLVGCLALLDEAEQLIERFGLRRYHVFACCVRSNSLCLLGDLPAAEAALAPLDDLVLEGVDGLQRADAHAMVNLFAGEYDRAGRAFDAVAAEADALRGEFAIGIALHRSDVFVWRAELEAARNAIDDGRALVEKNSDAFWYGWLAMSGIRVEADAAAAASSAGSLVSIETARTRANDLAVEWSAFIEQRETPSPLIEAQSFAIGAELARVNDEGTAEIARRAAGAFAALAMPYYATYFRWREAEAMLGVGKRPAATEILKAARSTALRHGFTGLETEINTLARTHQLRLGPARTTVDGDEALSVRELEVLRLIVDGRSNPEIADSLFISRRTAAADVSAILRKLDATSRVEAASEALRRGVV